MPSFGKTAVRAVVGLALVATVARGQQAPSSPTVPPALAARVAGLIARQWMVDSATVQLQWGLVRTSDSFPATTVPQLIGRGDGGWFAVTFLRGSAPMFAVRVRAGCADSVMTTVHALAKGVTLSAADIQESRTTRWGPPIKSDVNATPGPGWVTLRAFNIGEAITAASVTPPPVIHTGDQVQLRWSRGGVVIALEAVALQNGGVGQTVRVRLVERGGERSGTVIAPGLIKLES